MPTKLITADKGGAKFQAALNSMGISVKQLKKELQNGCSAFSLYWWVVKGFYDD